MANKTNELSHSKLVCKYHIVFTPKYRRKIIYSQTIRLTGGHDYSLMSFICSSTMWYLKNLGS